MYQLASSFKLSVITMMLILAGTLAGTMLACFVALGKGISKEETPNYIAAGAILGLVSGITISAGMVIILRCRCKSDPPEVISTEGIYGSL